MSYRLRVAEVRSVSRLSGALPPAEAGEYGDYEPPMLTVAEKAVAEDLAELHNVELVEEQPDYPTNDDGEPLCVGKEDGQCSRTVDEPGSVCWQHPADD